MENDVLKNKIAPWQEKGRWYKFTVLSDGSNYSMDNDRSDLTTTISSGSGNIFKVFKKIYDLKAYINKHTIASNTNIAALVQVRIMNDGTYAIHVAASASNFKEMVIYAFGELA